MNATANTESIRQGWSSANHSELRPVIVLNLFYSGLGIARQLSGTGVRVVGLSADKTIYGNFTRSCEVRVAPNSQEEPRQLADFLLRASTDLRGAIIFPTRDADVLFLDRYRSELEPLYILAIPPRAILFRLIDKAEIARTAIQAGIPAPKTAVARDYSQLHLASDKVGFPCVVKPLRSVHWREGNAWKHVGERKAFRADSLAELSQHYGRISQVRREVLVQEWIPGGADHILVWGGYVRRGLKPLAFFTATKIVQSPDDFGTGCVVESDDFPDLVEPSVHFCQALGYEGIAEIEYKRDPRDEQLKLIEINARHWDWHELGSASGVNLTWIAYRHLAGMPIQAVDRRTQRSKWIAEDAFLTHTMAGFYAGTFTPAKAWRAVAGKRIYGMFASNDPVPFLRYFFLTLLPALLARAVRKLRRNVGGGPS